ncbi:dihydrofolate reductase family protein [Georgenia sp. Marseille-Q6866]
MHPRVICHMLTSVDGRLIPQRWTPLHSGNSSDLLLDAFLRTAETFDADAGFLGRVTIQTDFNVGDFDRTGLPPTSDRSTHVAPRNNPRLMVVSDPRGLIEYLEPTLNGDDVVAVLGTSVSDAYLEHLRGLGISYLFAGDDGRNLTRALEVLAADFAVTTLLLQGGGLVNGAFLTAGLIDELSVLIHAGIDGASDSPSYVEAEPSEDRLPAAGRTLELRGVETLEEGMVWLRYTLHGAASGDTAHGG